MKFRLKNYQDDAVAEVLANLRKCRTWWHADKDRSAFALSAPTAAGKTVIAGAVIEALFHGNDDYKVEPDPGAVVIWLSDDPSLNAQSRYRLQQCADRIAWSELLAQAGPALERIRDEALSRFRELEARLEELTRPAD